jgi:hypothetical protein
MCYGEGIFVSNIEACAESGSPTNHLCRNWIIFGLRSASASNRAGGLTKQNSSKAMVGELYLATANLVSLIA